ncbi:hypothetical protein U9M48_011920 [Paspalum notatum var. saurae]|uniref:chitinase n=1 Tax=Paspalum notatum var. saurae TaxID=547442 RepID=A0AAQ3WI27_PASNO
MLCVLTAAVAVASAQQCGSQVGGVTCRDCLCCSCFGFLGDTSDAPAPAPRVASVVPRDLLLLHRDNAACPARGLYTYDAFVAAAAAFPAEVAAFLGQTSHETTGG